MTLLRAACIASLFAPSLALAEYGAHVEAGLTVGERQTEVIGGIPFELHTLTATVSGGCATGNNPTYEAGIHGTRNNPWFGGLGGASDLTFQEVHSETVDPGTVVWSYASVNCGDQAGFEMKSAESEKLVVPPFLREPILLSTNPAGMPKCFPVGTEVLVTPGHVNYINTDASLAPVETMDLVIRGAGIDYTHTFHSDDELSNTEIKVTATSAGTVEMWIVKQPYDAKSNVLQLTAKVGGCMNEETPGEGTPDAGSLEVDAVDTEESGPFGCTTTAVTAPLLLGLGALLRRRRA